MARTTQAAPKWRVSLKSGQAEGVGGAASTWIISTWQKMKKRQNWAQKRKAEERKEKQQPNQSTSKSNTSQARLAAGAIHIAGSGGGEWAHTKTLTNSYHAPRPHKEFTSYCHLNSKRLATHVKTHARERDREGERRGEPCKRRGQEDLRVCVCVCVCMCEIPGPAERVLLSIMAAIKPETEMFEYIAI